MKTKPSSEHCVVHVVFEREVNAEELESLQMNFEKGIIKTNPLQNLVLAIQQQLAAELQEAYDECGIGGHFQVETVVENTSFDFTK